MLSGDPANGWVNVPDSASLDITGHFTFEAWVSISNSVSGEDCRSIAGKQFTTAWWIGQCNVGGQPTLRSYLKGSASLRQGGIIPRNVLTHIAVVYNGVQRLHYINGELAASFAESGLLPTNGQPLQIGSDVSWVHSPSGLIDEVRLWNVARTTAEIRANLNKRIGAQPGLVARWTLDGNGNDVVSSNDGTVQGSGTGFLTFPAGLPCTASTTSALLPAGPLHHHHQVAHQPDARHAHRRQRRGGRRRRRLRHLLVLLPRQLGGDGQGDRRLRPQQLATGSSRRATTNVFYRMEVFDSERFEQKVYFNYAGPPAPAVTDTDAFATCP